MNDQKDINKIIRQHCQLEKIISGGFQPRGEVQIPIPDIENAKTPANPENSSQNSPEEKLKKLAEQINACRKCELGSTRKNCVVGAGDINARIMFVGEAPGATEDEQGIPFIGRAGKMLSRIIAGMGINRDEVYITNIIKCRPPGNRDPKTEEIVKCIDYLTQQIEIIKPEIIIALGAHAAKTLLNTDKAIGKLRGMFHQYKPTEKAQPIKVMPTYHPSYLVRNYSDDSRRRVWQDMQKVLAELGLQKPKQT
jgi:DNA polymerase